jgi:hypothetical protein
VRTKLAEVTSQIAKAEAPRTAQPPAAAAVVAAPPEAPAYQGSKIFVQISSVYPPLHVYNETPFTQTTSSPPIQMAVRSGGLGVDLAFSYAFAGMHAVTFTSLKDDNSPQTYQGTAQTNGIGYRFIARRGEALRPVVGLHLSLVNVQVQRTDGGPQLAQSQDKHIGLEPELGVMYEAPSHIVAQAFLRLDALAFSTNTLIMPLIGAGVGAHF